MCLESGWMSGDGAAWPGMYGNLDLSGASGHTLNVHTPPWDAAPLQAVYGTDALYDMKPGHRNTPFTSQDIDANHVSRLGQVQEAYDYDSQGPYAISHSRPTPTTIYKKCDVGQAECDPSRAPYMGIAVSHECDLGQCNANTGSEAAARWQQDP